MSNCIYSNITHQTVGNNLIITTYNLDGTANPPYTITADTQDKRLKLFNQYWAVLNKGMNCVSPISPAIDPIPSLNNLIGPGTNTPAILPPIGPGTETPQNYLSTKLDETDHVIQSIINGITKVISYTGAPFFGEFTTADKVDSDAKILRKFGSFFIKNMIVILILAIILKNVDNSIISTRGKFLIVIVSIVIFSVSDQTFGFLHSFTPATCKAMCKCENDNVVPKDKNY